MNRSVVRTLSLIFICYLGVSPAYSADKQKTRSSRVQQQEPPVAVRQPVPPSILSIIPAQAESGSKVVVYGSDFGAGLTVFLGSQEIVPMSVSDTRAEFLVPLLDQGLYALYLKRADGLVGKTYNFNVMALRPVLTALAPDQISSCAEGKEREITAMGRNFTDQSLVLLDGVVIKSRLMSPESLSFTAPAAMKGGLHQIVVRNGMDNGSVPLGFALETRPEIGQVGVGKEFVNYYELVIEGKNFNQNSYLLVDGRRLGGTTETGTERERLIFDNCTRLVYQRHPYSSVPKDFRLQVVNQDGEGSQVITVSAP